MNREYRSIEMTIMAVLGRLHEVRYPSWIMAKLAIHGGLCHRPEYRN